MIPERSDWLALLSIMKISQSVLANHCLFVFLIKIDVQSCILSRKPPSLYIEASIHVLMYQVLDVCKCA